MLDVNYIRNQITLVATPGIFTAQVIHNVSKEAERHAADCVVQGLAGTLYEGKHEAENERLRLVRGDLEAVLQVITINKERQRRMSK